VAGRKDWTEEQKARHAAAVAAANRRRKGEKRPDQASTHSPESDAKRSEAMKRRWADPEYKARLSEADKASRTPESNARRSETHKELWEDPEYRARRAETEAQPEVKERRSAAAKAKHAEPEFKERHREGLRRAWEEHPEAFSGSLDHILAGPVNDLEVAVLTALAGRDVAFMVHKRLDRYEADIYVPELRLDIECDGTYWHSRPGRASRDAKRDARLGELGYNVLRLTETEITTGDWSRLDTALGG
jgi:hypothetical protein